MADTSREKYEKKENEREVAVIPLDQIDVPDANAARTAVDAWLRRMSGGWVTLLRVETLAGPVPVLGNLLAACDAVFDILVLIEDKATDDFENFLNWLSLGINTIGIVPAFGNGARTALRPTLHLVRQEFRGVAKGLKNGAGNVLVDLLIGHVNTTLAGTIENFVKEAENLLDANLQLAADKAHELLTWLARGLRAIADGDILDDALPDLPAAPWHDPSMTVDNPWTYWSYASLPARTAWTGAKTAMAAQKWVANKAMGYTLSQTDAAPILKGYAKTLDGLAGQVRTKILSLGNAKTPMSIGWLLAQLMVVVTERKRRDGLKSPQKEGSHSSRKSDMPDAGKPDAGPTDPAGTPATATVSPDKVAEHDRKKGQGQQESTGTQDQAKADPNACKNCAVGGTIHAISFATGSETISHTDFALPGLMPIVWSRTYYSRLSAYDTRVHAATQSATPAYLGARWITPYTTGIDQAADGSLMYHAADGRSHAFPKLTGPDDDQPGQTHHNPIEDLTLGRANDGLLILSHGRDYIETFELAPAFWRDGKARTVNKAACYRLASQRTRTGHRTDLSYRHAGGQLSDIVSGPTHVCTVLDAQGRIQGLWQVQDGTAVRQLAAYAYEDRADGSSDLVAAQDENQGARRYGYLADTHLLSSYTDRTGRAMHLQWKHEDSFDIALTPANSASAKAYREWAGDGSFDTTIVWNKHIRLASVIDALGNETRHYCDRLGYTYRIVHPDVLGADGRVYAYQEWFMRDANKNITAHLHPDGSQDRYTYDAHSNLVSHTRADYSTVHFAHDDMDNLTGIRDAEGHAWKRTYEGANLIEEIDPLGHKTEYAYNEHGLPVEITDAKGGKKQLAYDDAGQLTAYTDCSGKTSSWAHDDRGRLLEAKNAAGETTRYHYERGQLTGIVNPDGTEEQLAHDAEGRLLSHRDALQRETRYEYNAVGLIAQRVDANRNTIDYQWDRLGRLAVLRNENSRTYSFNYDPLGKLLSEVQFDGSKTAYGYTPATGVLHQVTEGDALTQFDFDPTGRLTKRMAGLYIEPEGSQGRPTDRTLDQESIQTDSYAYDGNGQLIDARNPHIHLQWFPDAAGNVRTEHHHYLIDEEGRPSGQPMTAQTAVWQHRYDELGNRIQTTRPDGHTTTWLTYGSGHVHGLMLDDMETLQIERDDLHREVKRIQANEVAQEQQYDPAGRLKAQVLSRVERLGQGRGGSSAPNASALGIQRKYSYDRAGQLTDIGDSRRGSLSYRYDPVGRLVQAQRQLGTETFAFDPASNILDPMASPAREAGTLNNIPAILNNLVKDYAGTHFEYDSRGNMVQRLHNGQRTRFAWDALGRLTEARTQDTRTSFLYDPLGRRIAKRSEPIVLISAMDGSQYHAGKYRHQMHERGLGTVFFGWDGDQMAWESDSARNRTVHYVFEPHSFVPLLQAKSNVDMRRAMLQRPQATTATYVDAQGNYDLDQDPLYNGMYEAGVGQDGEPPEPLTNIHYYQCDHLGTPMELTDEGGNIAWEANYRAWGEARLTISEAATKAGLKNPIRFQGQYLDEETGLHYNRFRYYDPVVGRFVSKDPIGLLGGFNLHHYVPNPTEWIDPLGLSKGGKKPCQNKKNSTEPKLPEKIIAQNGGLRLEHYVRSGDHGPAHFHLRGEGNVNIQIGQNGKPINSKEELTAAQSDFIKSNKSKLRTSIDKIQRWHRYNNLPANCK
jgi:RHS repeat-associated protein